LIIFYFVVTTINPISLSIIILATSLIATVPIYKVTSRR